MLRLLTVLIVIILFGCYSSTNKIVKKPEWQDNCDRILKEISYDKFIKNAKNTKRDDSLISMKIDTIFNILGPLLLNIEKIFTDTNFSIIKIEVLPNGNLKIKNYNDSLTFDTTYSKGINKSLKSVFFDSIPNYNASKEIIIMAEKNNENIEFNKNFKTKFISSGRSRASIMCVTANNLADLRYLYNERLFEKPGLKGRISVKFAVDEYGKVIFAKVTSTTMDDSKLENIMLEKIRTWKYPRIYRPGDVTEIFYPFVFSQ